LLNQSGFREIFYYDIIFLSSTKECSDTDFACESKLFIGPFSLTQPNSTQQLHMVERRMSFILWD